MPDSAGFLEIVINDYGIYINDNDNFWVSTDEGITWKFSKLDSIVDYFDALTVYNGVIYVGGYRKIYKSSVSSDEWTEIIVDDMNESVNSIHVFDSIIF